MQATAPFRCTYCGEHGHRQSLRRHLKKVHWANRHQEATAALVRSLFGTAAPGSQASVSDPAASMPASAVVLAVAPATASSVLPVGRAAVSVPSDPAAVVALASAPATSSHPVLGLGVGHKDQHADFAMQRRASLWHDWHPVPMSELYVMTMDLEHVAADDVATTVRRRYGLPPRRQVGLRCRVSTFRLARRRAQGEVLAMLPHGDVDGNSAIAAIQRLGIWATRPDTSDPRPFE